VLRDIDRLKFTNQIMAQLALVDEVRGGKDIQIKLKIKS
jgi:hypothetical protein